MTDWTEENPLRGVDRPRPLPTELRALLEEQLAEGVMTAVLPEGITRPRPLPPGARARVTRALLRETRPASRRAAAATGGRTWYRSSGARQWMPVAAAVLLLFAAVVGALSLGMGSSESPIGDSALSESGARFGEETGIPPGAGGPAPPFSDLQLEAPASNFDAADGEAAPSPAAGRDAATESDARAGAQPAGTVRVGLSGPDNAVAAGFRAYMNTVNSQGGIGGSRRVETVNPASSGLMATVSTSLAGPLDPRSAGPRLEGPAAQESRLRDDTFSFASAPERLGHLLADALYPQAKPGASVVLFTGSGVFDEVVPAAVEAALREKGIVPARVTTRSGRPGQWPAAEVAVLSMDAEEARSWLSAAASEGYRPPRGVAGLWSLADPSLTAELPEGSTVLTSYATPRQAEAQAMTRAAGGPPSFGFVHGWASAKALALALWQSGAATPAELTRALRAFPADDLGGLIAPYRVRPNTNSRTPEGLALVVRGGTLVPQGGFRADPRT